MLESGEVSVPPSTLIRWGGIAAIVAAVLLVLAEILGLGFIGRDANVAIVTGSYTFYSVLLTAAAVLLPLGLVSLYARQAEASGPLGLLSFFLAFAGTILVAGLFWIGTLLVPAIVGVAPGIDSESASDFVRVGATPGFSPSIIAFALGWLLFGIASLQTQVYHRPAVMLLIIGAVISAIPLPLSTVVLAAAIAWLGYDLFTNMGATEERTTRPSRVR